MVFTVIYMEKVMMRSILGSECSTQILPDIEGSPNREIFGNYLLVAICLSNILCLALNPTYCITVDVNDVDENYTE